MKKNISLILVMTLMAAVNTFAQVGYNMVITLNNGTTVTLGNDNIKEIVFNNGDISISGNMVNTIDSLASVTLSLEEKISKVEEDSGMSIDSLRYVTSNLEDKMMRVDDFSYYYSNMQAQMDANTDCIQQQSAVIEMLYNGILNLQTTIYDLHEEIHTLHPDLVKGEKTNNARSISDNTSTNDLMLKIADLKKAFENIKTK